MRMLATRLHRGQDVKASIEAFVREQKISAGAIISAVGCLSQARLRMADATSDKQEVRDYNQPLEVVSLIGNVGQERMHLHLALSDANGKVVGGHMKDGCIVDTTLELVIAVDDSLEFSEEPDPRTGFGELKISRR
jgi:predicted DNA-binding protein with PD1-like motif